MAENEKKLTHDELTKTIALELLADHPEEERRLVEAMPASCITIDGVIFKLSINIQNVAIEFNDYEKDKDFRDLPNEEYNKLLDDVNTVSPFQGSSHSCDPAAMVKLVTAYGKSLGVDEPFAFEAGFEFLKPHLDNIRKYL